MRAIGLAAPLGAVILRSTVAVADEPEQTIVVVAGVSPDADTPISRSEISADELDARYHGQELAWSIAETPSVMAWSDSGLGYGYSYFSVRGLYQARMVVTFDGAPLNDLLDMGVYSSNFGDLSSSLSGLQLQRGVGTGSVGAASFAGALHLQSADPPDRAGGELTLGVGSFDWKRGSLRLDTGAIRPGWTASFRLSGQQADGWRDRSEIAQHTFFGKTVYARGRTRLSLSGFSGRERMGLSYYAIDLDTYAVDPTNNPLGSEAKDAFGQDVAVATLERDLGKGRSFVASGWYNGAGGHYQVDSADAEGNPALSRWGLRYHTVGARSVGRFVAERRTVELGLTALAFFRQDRRTLDGAPDYDFDGRKLEGSAFVRWNEAIGDWRLYGDAQLRHARFAYDADVDVAPQQWTFVTPKLGVRRTFGAVDLWASAGYGGREPTRGDLFAGLDDPTAPVPRGAVKPEKLVDVEAGVDLRLENATVKLGVFAMEFRDEIALTGELTETGGYLRTNLDQSFRRGVELEATWRPVDWLELRNASSLNWARIARWTQVYDVFDPAFAWIGQTERTYTNPAPLLTPPVIVDQRVAVFPVPGVTLGVGGRYVAAQQLDNTGDADLVLPAYATLDADVTWVLPVDPPVRLQLHGSNLTSAEAFPSGYAWSYAIDDGSGPAIDGIPYVYPMAPAAVDVTVTIGF